MLAPDNLVKMVAFVTHPVFHVFVFVRPVILAKTVKMVSVCYLYKDRQFLWQIFTIER